MKVVFTYDRSRENTCLVYVDDTLIDTIHAECYCLHISDAARTMAKIIKSSDTPVKDIEVYLNYERNEKFEKRVKGIGRILQHTIPGSYQLQLYNQLT